MHPKTPIVAPIIEVIFRPKYELTLSIANDVTNALKYIYDILNVGTSHENIISYLTNFSLEWFTIYVDED